MLWDIYAGTCTTQAPHTSIKYHVIALNMLHIIQQSKYMVNISVLPNVTIAVIETCLAILQPALHGIGHLCLSYHVAHRTSVTSELNAIRPLHLFEAHVCVQMIQSQPQHRIVYAACSLSTHRRATNKNHHIVYAACSRCPIRASRLAQYDACRSAAACQLTLASRAYSQSSVSPCARDRRVVTNTTSRYAPHS